MLDDQKELAAKQKAVSNMGQGGAAKAAKTGPKKPLSTYQNQMNPIGFGSNTGPNMGGLGSTNGLTGTAESGVQAQLGNLPSAAGAIANYKPQASSTTEVVEEEVTTDRYDPNNIGADLYATYQRLNDQEAAEERIARARAAQEGMIRATMGAGEAGRSGAAALLQGEGGRMAEGQARAAELANDLEVAELGSALRNFDFSKERYNDTEKKQAASAIMSLINAYDVDYDEAIEMLQLPEGVASDSHRKVVEDWRTANFTDDDGDETTETETTETTETDHLGNETTNPIYGTPEAEELYEEHSYMSNQGDGGWGHLPQRVIDTRYISLPAGTVQNRDMWGNYPSFTDADGTVLREYKLPNGDLVWVNRGF
jgi:hypothetical protein